MVVPVGKDIAFNRSISHFQKILQAMQLDLVEEKWNNPVPGVFSVHLRARQMRGLFSNGKGQTRQAALASAYGEFCERLLSGFFFYHFMVDVKTLPFAYHPRERWIQGGQFKRVPLPHLDDVPISKLKEKSMVGKTGVLALPFVRERDQVEHWMPMNLITNLYMSNGLASGNSLVEAKVQALSEVYERAIKRQVIAQQIALPDIPQRVIERYPQIAHGVAKLRADGFGVWIKDASLGGVYPVVAILLIDPQARGIFASFGAHPCCEVAIGRTLTELLQGRHHRVDNFFSRPLQASDYIASNENWLEHFVDSSGSVSWKFLLDQPAYAYTPWGLSGRDREQEWNFLMAIARKIKKEVYCCDYSAFGVPVCHVIVPEFSEVYSWQEVEENNNNVACKYFALMGQLQRQSDITPLKIKKLLNWMERTDFLPDRLLVEDFLGTLQVSDFSQLSILGWKVLLNLQLGKRRKLQQLVEQYRFDAHLNLWDRALVSYAEMVVCGFAKARITAYAKLAMPALLWRYCQQPAQAILDLAKAYHQVSNPQLVSLLKRRAQLAVPPRS